jgi:hypothetical protein
MYAHAGSHKAKQVMGRNGQLQPRAFTAIDEKIEECGEGALTDYSYDHPQVFTDIELLHVRILPCGDVRQFLVAIAHSCWAPTAQEIADAEHWINGELLRLAWDTPPWGSAVRLQRMTPDLDEEPPTLSLHRSGSAAGYLDVRQHHVRPKAAENA